MAIKVFNSDPGDEQSGHGVVSWLTPRRAQQSPLDQSQVIGCPVTAPKAITQQGDRDHCPRGLARSFEGAVTKILGEPDESASALNEADAGLKGGPGVRQSSELRLPKLEF